jgi:uncharacterized protein involved in type VI secretion and phage assembly
MSSEDGVEGDSGSQDDEDSEVPKRFMGKYRGLVANNVDPLQIGRINAIVPDVSNVIPTSWAMPCFPVGGPQNGMFAVPPIGSSVWIEFEKGDPDKPIWTGCFYGSPAEVPAMARMAPPPIPGITFQTALQNGVTISDVPGPTGGIVIKSSTGAMLIVNDTGIYIQNGKGASIIMVGNTVTINNGALVVI